MKKDISIIVPAYNEERRIDYFLKDLVKFSKHHLKNYEIIIVDDGSVDNTSGVVKRAIGNDRNIRLISYKPNRGKGYAVKKGIFESEGDIILFIDSDGSINPDQIPKMLDKLKQYSIVTGDRGAEESKVKQAKSRKIIGIIFNFYVSLLFKTKKRDNLCGFKGFHRDVARELFKDLISERWLFDVELFYKIKKRRDSLYNLPINWEHKQGSKIKFTDPLKMLFQLIVLRLQLIGK